jgi:hypothetical protein
MNLPKLTAEQSLGAAQGVYANKVSLGVNEWLGVTTMMIASPPSSKELQKLAASQVVGGVCYPSNSECNGRLTQRGRTLLECCANREEVASYRIPIPGTNEFYCFDCARLSIPREEPLILDELLGEVT